MHDIGKTLKESIQTAPGRLIVGKTIVTAVLALAIAEIAFVTRIDIAITREIHGWTAGWLTAIVSGVTDLGGTTAVMWVTAGALVALAALRHWRGAAALLLAVVTTQATVMAAKALMARPRPDDAIAVADPSGWSFPSGHSASAVALYVMLALIATTIWRRQQLRPALAFAIAGTIVVLVGLSRVYLGAHYPTDVLAGWLTGGIVVVASWALCTRLPHPRVVPA